MRRATLFICLMTALAACKSTSVDRSDEPRAPAAKAPSSGATEATDFTLLRQRVQMLRDREVGREPSFEPAADYVAPPECVDACRNERELLGTILFGGPLPLETRRAHFDPEKNAVVYDADLGADEREFHVAAALVEGIDRATGAPLGPARTWDGHLARQAVRRGAGVFVATLLRGQKEQDAFTPEELALFPETFVRLAPAEVVFDFGDREGFALAAAMYRAGGWSAVELLRHEPPPTSRLVVRPDLYLRRVGTGEWKWPDATTSARTAGGWETAETGRVGVATFVAWLSQHIDPAVARSAYVGFESDSYRTWRRGDTWIWEWASLWSTPDVARQIVELLEAGLRARADGSTFTVLHKGLTVMVVGTNTEERADLELASQLVEARPLFRPGDPSGLAFQRTPADRLASDGNSASLDEGMWTDPVTGMTIDTSGIAAWKVQKTENATLRWFAHHPDESVLELTTEVRDPLGPRFDTPAYAERLEAAFRKTVPGATAVAVQRTERPRPNSLRLELEAAMEGVPGHLTLWQFPVGEFVVTLSLQGSADVFDQRLAEVEPLLDAMTFRSSNDSPEGGAGVIRFEVEE